MGDLGGTLEPVLPGMTCQDVAPHEPNFCNMKFKNLRALEIIRGTQNLLRVPKS